MQRLNCDIILGRVYCVSDKIEKREMVDKVIISYQCKVENRSKQSTIPG